MPLTDLVSDWLALNSRLIINRVQGPLHGAGLPPPRPALVRQQIETDEGIRAVFGEGYQVTEDTQDKTVSHTCVARHMLFGLTIPIYS